MPVCIVSVSVSVVPLVCSYFWETWGPSPPPPPGVLGPCDHHDDLQDCWGSTVPCSMIYVRLCLEATLNDHCTRIPRPSQPSPAQICICHLRCALTVLGKQSSTSPNVMLMESNTNNACCCFFGRSGPNIMQAPTPDAITSSLLGHHFASVFRETFPSPDSRQNVRCHPNTSRLPCHRSGRRENKWQ